MSDGLVALDLMCLIEWLQLQWRIQDFPEEGAPTLKEAIIWLFFSKKLHEIERVWTPGGGAVAGAPA